MDPAYVAGGGRDTGRDAADPGAALAAVRRAREDPDAVLLEGVHALKHALRFGATVEAVVTPDRAAVEHLLDELAPDVTLPAGAREVDPETWRRLVPREPPSPVVAVAARPPPRLATVLAQRHGRVVVLEQPRHLGNLGAAVRTAAAAGAAGVLVLGDADPWHPTAVRAAAGLQFALPVAAARALPDSPRPRVAIDPTGSPLGATPLPTDPLLLFGTERAGLSAALRARADERVAIPMRAGVSSLNLATAVGVVLYAG